MSALSKDVVCPVALLADVAQDPTIAAYRRLCNAGDPMPSFPAMETVWRVLGEAQAAAVAGKAAEPVARWAAMAVQAAVQ
jgi:arabinogalactan oligomer/maltooligosaccharide transport system substrate-binding protein